MQVGHRPAACTDTPTDEAPKVTDDGRGKMAPNSLSIIELEKMDSFPFLDLPMPYSDIFSYHKPLILWLFTLIEKAAIYVSEY